MAKKYGYREHFDPDSRFIPWNDSAAHAFDPDASWALGGPFEDEPHTPTQAELADMFRVEGTEDIDERTTLRRYIQWAAIHTETPAHLDTIVVENAEKLIDHIQKFVPTLWGILEFDVFRDTIAAKRKQMEDINGNFPQ